MGVLNTSITIQIFLLCSSPEEFERRIDSELAALDSLTLEESNKSDRHSIVSEDLLKFDESSTIDSNEQRNAMAFANSLQSELSDRLSINADAKCNREPIARMDSSDSSKSDVISRSIISKSSNFMSTHSDIANAGDSSKQADHLSCEDLLEFSCNGPSARGTRGPRNGENSDEVRIMLKVLQEQSSPESCLAALNVSEWNVLAAIKLERLQGILRKENHFVGLEDCKVMLNQCGGDVAKAAALLRTTEDSAAV